MGEGIGRGECFVCVFVHACAPSHPTLRLSLSLSFSRWLSLSSPPFVYICTHVIYTNAHGALGHSLSHAPFIDATLREGEDMPAANAPNGAHREELHVVMPAGGLVEYGGGASHAQWLADAADRRL